MIRRSLVILLIMLIAACVALAAPAQPASAATRPGVGDAERSIADLISDLGQREPVAREAAIRRLIAIPQESAQSVIDALAEGGLSTRLGALEILREWGGPVEGLDPWRPDTLTADRLEKLRAWVAKSDHITAGQPAGPNPRQLDAARRELARLLQDDVTLAEGRAIEERLARYGESLLPEVSAVHQRAVTDSARERLTRLRYRLVVSDELVSAWPDGLDRLAASDFQTRRGAAEELVGRCGPADERLLLELFHDSDPQMREIALGGLSQAAGGRLSEALVRLLKDSRPSVRAAVLEQLAATPSQEIVPHLAGYVAGETDAGLLVHAVRLLRLTKGRGAADCLMTFIRHEDWRVRAEAAEGLGEMLAEGTELPNAFRTQAYKALMARLQDEESFVAGVAIRAMNNTSLPEAADALAGAADRHPELTPEVLAALAENSDLRAKAIPHLRRFCGHDDDSVRASAIAALCKAVPHDAKEELAAALADASSNVRIAAAAALLEILESIRPQRDEDASVHAQAGTEPPDSTPVASGPASPPEIPLQNRWLAEFRSGRRRPEWLESMTPGLRAMLFAELPEERLIAAVDLLPFGQDQTATPVLLEVVSLRPDLTGPASAALPWLEWDERLALFDLLVGAAADAETINRIAKQMAVWPDPRAGRPLWDLLGHPAASVETAALVFESLRKVYFGDYRYSPASASAERRARAIADAVPRVRAGSELQRCIALALLLSVSLEEAAVQAAGVLGDPQASDDLRRDAFQVQLLSQDEEAGQRLAADALAGFDPVLHEQALRLLAEGPDSLADLRGGAIHLYYQNASIQAKPLVFGQPVRVTAPARLTPDVLRPLLGNSDARMRALAGYLLATLGDPAGLDSLAAYWREQAREDPAVRRMVYRAVAALGDDGQIALLEEIYRTFIPNDYWLRDFYWTIRTMSGPKAVALCEQIHSKVGMDALR